MIILPSRQTKTTLHFGENFIDASLLKKLSQNTKIVIIADTYFESFVKELQFPFLIIEGGEIAKTQKKKEEIETFLFKEKCGKDTTLIALGGGTITDLVAFTASTYMRGIPLILIPTTLLAMVDAAIGGKTSINTPFGKNLLGTYYSPNAILCDFQFLKTLSLKEWRNGVSEILKMGLIRDPSLYQTQITQEIIQKAILRKIEIVNQDPYDQGFRKILNFGHTVGHALETVSKYTLSHGEAVAIGGLIESHLSMDLGFLSASNFQEIKKMFSLDVINYPAQTIIEAMRLDKKNQNQEIHIVLIDRIGHALEFEGKYTKPVSEPELLNTLKHYAIS